MGMSAGISVSFGIGFASPLFCKLTLKTVTDLTDSDQTTYFYDGVNNLIRTEFPNGIIETREYDDLDRLLVLKNTLDDTVLSSYTYTLDKVGHRRVVQELDGRTVEYDYDDLYRLREEKITDPNDPANDGRIISYTYDNVGNRLTKIDSVEGITTYFYDDNDRLLTEERVKDGVVVESIVYTYDDNGNTTARLVNGTEETIYVWNDDGRLVQVILPDGTELTYEYDVDGIRVSATKDGVTTEYLVDKNLPYAQVLEEYINGQLQVRYIHGHDLIEQERNGEESVYLVDGLGSTRVLTDENGELVATYDYEAFGEVINATEVQPVENEYRFAGEQFDEELEQYYLRDRFYDQSNGRFTRRDTFEGNLIAPNTLHKYIYANNQPTHYVDPSGLFSTLTEVSTANSIREILAGIQGQAGLHFLAMASQGEEPTLANTFTSIGRDILITFGGAFALRLFGLVISKVGAVLDEASREIVSIISRTASQAAQKYDLGDCQPCSVAIKNAFKNKGIPGRRVIVETNIPNQFLINDQFSTTEAVATNGKHYANIVDIDGVEYAYDNLFKEGIPLQDWLDGFDAIGGVKPIETLETY